MSLGIIDAATAIAQAFTDDERAACYTDPAEAVNNRPCLLVAPPRLDFADGGTLAGPAVRWRLIALSSHAAGVFDALVELDDLVDVADDVIGLERAEPIQYPLTKDGTRVAAYVLTLTEFSIDTTT